MVTLQRNQTKNVTDAPPQALDNFLALRPLIDVIADRDNDAGIAARMRGNTGKTVTKQIVSAVDVWDDVGIAHELKWRGRNVRVKDVSASSAEPARAAKA